MDLVTFFTILGVIASIIIGVWQIILAMKKSKESNDTSSSMKETPKVEDRNISIPSSVPSAKISYEVLNKEFVVDEDKPIRNYNKNPTPEEIMKKVTALDVPPFQRKEIGKNYASSFIGLGVDWELDFHLVFPNQRINEQLCDSVTCFGGYYSISLTVLQPSLVTFFVNLKNCPEFKILREREKIRVKGMIQSVDEYGINLCDVEISFLNR